MTDAAEPTGQHFKVFENFVFYPPLVKARELLQSGAIGQPLHFRMKMVLGASDRSRSRATTKNFPGGLSSKNRDLAAMVCMTMGIAIHRPSGSQ